MIICHSKRFILMTPWKCASSTCHKSLEAYNESPYHRFFHWNASLNRVVHQHLTLADLLALPEGKLGYKVGTFVRNPYDRAYSGFKQLQKDFAVQPRMRFDPAWVGDLVRTQAAENAWKIMGAGFNFDKWIAALPAYEVFEAGRNTSMALHPANYWTHVNGKVCVEFVGKVENFDQDFLKFCNFVNIPVPPITSKNVTDRADAENAAGSKYASRMSRRALDRINDLFAKDFEQFEYEML